ncbi:MAG: M10 family metallopeptidase C-terminal domain-containing protein [Allosphingosinicella sp.]
MCSYCAMKGLRSRSDPSEQTNAHFGAKDSLANIAAASAGELTPYDLQSLQMSAVKLTEAFPMDGVGDLKLTTLVTDFLITTDNVPDAPDTAGSTNPVLTVTGPGVTIPIVSTIDIIGDQDFYKVTLTAGTTYELGLYSYNGGPNLVGLTDPYMELYGADGTTLVVSADGGADTPYNQTNSGFDVLLTYTPAVSGTYYVNARAFSNSPLTPTGDSIGDYQLFAREQDPNDPNVYRPYYQPDEPLYALDWGSQVNRVNQSARNPDGNEGARSTSAGGADPTGNAQGTPVYSSLLDIPALAASQGKDITGKNVITIYFAKQGDLITSLEDPASPGLPPATLALRDVQAFELDAVMTALGEFEKVADVVYLVVTDRAHADFTYASYIGTPGPGVSLLGSMSPPDEPDEGLAQFNSGDERWNAVNLAQGGFSFVTLIHEFGHGHGLAHPHDNGGKSGVMNGVLAEGAGVADYTTGDYGLNQGVFTMMSYEDGWQTSPYGNAPTDVGYGYLGGLMAFDIAAIQDKYGVNEEHATGNDVYTLKDVNAAGTFYYSIWDGGGTDSIVYDGNRDANIHLRPATLKYEPGGGGFVSYAYGIYGGFTVANGVTIENASGGGGNDTLRGNVVANILNGGSGADLILLQDGGDDTALGGEGNDQIYYGAAFTAADSSDGGLGTDVLILQGDYAVTMGVNSLQNFEYLSVQSGSSTRYQDTAGNSYSYDITFVDGNVGAGQKFVVNASQLLSGESFTFDGGAETDGYFLIYGGFGADTVTGGLGNDIFHFEGSRWGAGDVVDGGDGADAVVIRATGGMNTIAFGETQLTNIESISVSDRFALGGAGLPSYDLTLANGNVAPGKTLIVNGSTLLDSTQVMNVDGSAVQGGHLILYGGAGGDSLIGGDGNDLIYAAGGADEMTGGGGRDTFQLRNVADSSPSSPDEILDFVSGEDKIDLQFIDANANAAGNQAFAFIGASAFSGNAGELRAYGDSGAWVVEGDVNGDGVADFQIIVNSASALVGSDFIA